MTSKEHYVFASYELALMQLLELGYYDPEDEYATRNEDFLNNVFTTKDTTKSSTFTFKSKLLGQYFTLNADFKKDNYFRITAYWILDGKYKSMSDRLVLLECINNLANKYASPKLYLDKDTDLWFDLQVFLPIEKQSFKNTIEFFDQSVASLRRELISTFNDFKKDKQ